MNKVKLRAFLQQMIDDLEEDTGDFAKRPVTTGEQVLEELRESRRVLAACFARGLRDGEASIRASVPQSGPERRTLDAATAMSLQRHMSTNEYKQKKWESMSPEERIACQLEATTPADPEKDIAASSPAEIEAAIGKAMSALHPGARVGEMRGDTREQPPVLRRRVGECFGSPSDPIVGWNRGD